MFARFSAHPQGPSFPTSPTTEHNLSTQKTDAHICIGLFVSTQQSAPSDGQFLAEFKIYAQFLSETLVREEFFFLILHIPQLYVLFSMNIFTFQLIWSTILLTVRMASNRLEAIPCESFARYTE